MPVLRGSRVLSRFAVLKEERTPAGRLGTHARRVYFFLGMWYATH
jgi:hypothetical protein